MSDEYLADLASGVARLPRSDLAQALPRSLPRGLAPGWTGPEEGWPPRTYGVSDLQDFDLPGAETGFTEEETAYRERILGIALGDPRVREVLGDKFAHIDTDEIELRKGQDRPQPEAIPMRLTFFSHTHRVAVEVTLTGETINSVMKKPGYQPPEGEDEIQGAIAIARQDSQLRDMVQELEGKAIVAAPDPDHPEANPRTLYVTFSRSDEYLPVCGATVDLINEKVLSTSFCKKKEGDLQDGTPSIVE